MKTPGDTLEVGQSLVEYSLLLLLIAVIVIGSVWLVGMRVSSLYGRAATELEVPTGEPTPQATPSPPADCEWHGVVRDFEVRVEGGTFITFIDGEEVLRATDSEYAHGQVGLRTWDSSEVCFSQFHVSLLEDPDRGRDDRDLESERPLADRLLK